MAENLKRNDGLPPAMTRLVKELSRLPGIGEKTASRLAFNLLNRPRDEVIALAESLLEMKERVGLCAECFGLSDAPRCRICDDSERDHELICVVEGPADLMAIERARTFGGLYHVLHGAIAPLDGIGTTPEGTGPFRSVGFNLSTVGYAVSRRFRELLAPLELERSIHCHQ